jgi:hypothetical protein
VWTSIHTCAPLFPHDKWPAGTIVEGGKRLRIISASALGMGGYHGPDGAAPESFGYPAGPRRRSS